MKWGFDGRLEVEGGKIMWSRDSSVLDHLHLDRVNLEICGTVSVGWRGW